MKKKLMFTIICISLPLMWQHQRSSAEVMADYTAYPIHVTQSVKPNILFMISNDHTNFYRGYNNLTHYDNATEYYGYFNCDACYTYNGNYFEPSSVTSDHKCTGKWSGNFLNWLTMCHGDFVRKALTGGRRSSDTASPLLTILERGNIPTDDHRWLKDPDVTISQYTTYSNDSYTFYNTGITFKVKNGGTVVETYNVRVKVCDPSFGCEDNCNPDTFKPEGMIQRFSDKVRFGMMSYSYNKSDQGGVLRENIGGDINNLIYFVNNFTQKGWDPIGEMYYEGIKYFEHLSPTSDYTPASDSFSIASWQDPIQNWCQKNAVIVVNDEYPSKDHDKLPGSYWGSVSNPIPGLDVQAWTKEVGDDEGITGTQQPVGYYENTSYNCSTATVNNLGRVKGICPCEPPHDGTFHISGLAYYAHTTDLRNDFDHAQMIDTYTIAFRSTPSGYIIPPPPMNQLWLAAKYGGFHDINGNNRPDLQEEWDKDGNGVPDNFAYAEEGSQFEDALLKAITTILQGTASATAVSILSTSSEGESSLFQASFKPIVFDGIREINWLGYLNALWVDPYGNIREDTNHDNALVYTEDKIIRFALDEASGETTIQRYHDNDGDGKADSETPYETVVLSELEPQWEAGEKLALRAAPTRTIKTFVDKNENGVPDTGEVISFDTSNASTLRPFLDVDTDAEAANIISFIRGESVSTSYRDRNITIGGVEYVWKLGDIVYSTPAVVGKPSERYNQYYSDISYGAFFTQWKDRGITVYVGANDGMLHAFKAGTFNEGDNTATTGKEEHGWYSANEVPATTQGLGAERWAYIPYNLLPHLKWLIDPNYTHVYYVDLMPKVTDVRIFSSDANHPNGWGTILIGGMRLGGGERKFPEDFDDDGSSEERTFRSAYFILDITVPNNPVLLGEFTDANMAFTTSYPAIVRLEAQTPEDDKWFCIVGSGPTNYDGSSTQKGYVFVIDLNTKQVVKNFQTGEDKASMTSPITLDFDLDYNIDVIYIGETYEQSGNQGKMYRMSTRTCIDDDECTYLLDPNEWTKPSTLFSFNTPITASATASIDEDGNIWVYFGTGKYLNNDDKTDTTYQYYFYGIKDPCAYGGCTNKVTLTNDDNSSNIVILTNTEVEGATATTWDAFVKEVRAKQGWYIELVKNLDEPGERVLTRPSILGGVVLFSAFKPENDICGYGGTGSLYGLYYETGTSYYKPVLGTEAYGHEKKSLKRVELDKGVTSEIGLHVGKKASSTGFVQQSTGAVIQVEVAPAFSIRSGIVGWKQY